MAGRTARLRPGRGVDLGWSGPYPFIMTVIEFTREELALVHHALSAFLADFGHKEKDVVHALKALLGKIPTAG